MMQRPKLITQFEKPAFPIRVEKSVRQIVPVILRDFERLVPYALVQFLWGKFYRNEERVREWRNYLTRKVSFR